MDINLMALTALSSFLITYLSIPSLIKVAKEKQLYDEPNESRKSHHNSTPNLGGIAIFGGAMISATFFVDISSIPEIGYAFSAVLLLFFTGVKDDIVPLTPHKKLVAQIIAAIIIVVKCDVRLTNLYGFLWIESISYSFSVLISIFTLLVIINAFNLIDGINGLAGGIGLIVCLTFTYLFYQLGELQFVLLSLAICGALIAFLKYNLAKEAKIFMGDTGALMIGLFSSIFCIEFIELNRDSGILFKPTFAPVFAFAILIVPLFDTLRVFILRVSKNKSPFSGDRNHLHHFLIDSGLAHWQASLWLYFVNIFFIFLALIFKDISQILLLGLILSIAFFLSCLLFYLKIRQEDLKQRRSHQLERRPRTPQYIQREKATKFKVASESNHLS